MVYDFFVYRFYYTIIIDYCQRFWLNYCREGREIIKAQFFYFVLRILFFTELILVIYKRKEYAYESNKN